MKMPVTGEGQREAIRAAIRRAGFRAALLRGLAVLSVTVIPLTYVVLALLLGWNVGSFPFILAMALGIVLACTVGEWYRTRQGRRLRQEMAALPSDLTRTTIEPLMRDRNGDTEVLADELARQLGVERRDLVPSPAPEGRGDEISVSS